MGVKEISRNDDTLYRVSIPRTHMGTRLVREEHGILIAWALENLQRKPTIVAGWKYELPHQMVWWAEFDVYEDAVMFWLRWCDGVQE